MRSSGLRFVPPALVSGLVLQGLAVAAVDPRFGFVGTGGKAFAQRFGVPYYALEGNYHASTGTSFSSVHPGNDPAPGFKVLRKVAKLNVRIDALGQSNAQFQAAFEAYAQALVTWYLTPGVARPAKPAFTWYAPDAAALAAAESLQIVTTIRREKAAQPPITGTVWEIGNEPNFFPALPPSEYAAIYARYHRIIKGEDSAAQVAFGPLFIRETGEDLRAVTQDLVAAKLTASGALLLLGQARFDSVRADVEATLFSRIFNLGTAAYVSQAFAVLGPTVRPDYISLHVYPYDDRAPAQTKAGMQARFDSLVTAVRNLNGQRPVWITEFGNVNPGLSESAIAAGMSDLIDIFTANAGVGNLFYYKGTGADQQLDFLAALGAQPPLTRLANDSAFSPTDGNFACGQLNAIGRMYYERAVGAACANAAPSTAPTLVSPASFGMNVSPSASFAWTAVVGASSYQLQVSENPNFTSFVINDSAVPGPARAGAALAGGTDYYWRVRGRTVQGAGAWSDVWTFRTSPLAPPAPALVSPALFATVPPSTTLAWTAAAGATRYHVQVALDPDFTLLVLQDTAVTGTSRATGLLSGSTDYYWRVRGANTGGGPGAWSGVSRFSTEALSVPAAPTLLNPVPFAIGIGTDVSFRWSRVANTTSYHIQVAVDAAFSTLFRNDSGFTDTTRIIAGFGLATSYFWRVRARNPSGPGAWSDLRAFTTAPVGLLPGSPARFGLRHDGRSTLRFELPRSERVSLRMSDPRGKVLFTLDERLGPGPVKLALPSSSGGLRLLEVRIGNKRDVLKLAP